MQRRIEDSQSRELATQAEPQPKVDEYTYDYFCLFCIDTTTWKGMGNISECTACHSQGTNYSKECPRHESSSCYLFNIGNCVPSLPSGELLSLPDSSEQQFQCFLCCFDRMTTPKLENEATSCDLPFSYVYFKQEGDPEENHCLCCQADTKWEVFT